jgi:predicted ribosomally synthesized peptide with SipW-like signal peptide
MKINKKILMSSVLVGVLSMTAGVGTYAAFTAKVKSENNKIETITYTINNKIGEQSFPLFELSDAIPGSTAEVKGFEAKITGSKKMNITPNLMLTVSKRAVNNGVLADVAEVVNLGSEVGKTEYFEINTVVNFGDEKIFDSNGQFVSMKSFMDAINDTEAKMLVKDEMFSMSDGEIRLNSDAGNDYQGATVDVKLTLTADNLGTVISEANTN